MACFGSIIRFNAHFPMVMARHGASKESTDALNRREKMGRRWKACWIFASHDGFGLSSGFALRVASGFVFVLSVRPTVHRLSG